MIYGNTTEAASAPLEESSTWYLYWLFASCPNSQNGQKAKAILRARGYDTSDIPDLLRYRDPAIAPRRRRSVGKKKRGYSR